MARWKQIEENPWDFREDFSEDEENFFQALDDFCPQNKDSEKVCRLLLKPGAAYFYGVSKGYGVGEKVGEEREIERLKKEFLKKFEEAIPNYFFESGAKELIRKK